jgi:hypothetical protein
MAKPLPGLDVPVVNIQTGQMNQAWWEYFSSRVKLSQLPDVSTVAPTNNQVLVWNDTTKLWTPGAN